MSPEKTTTIIVVAVIVQILQCVMCFCSEKLNVVTCKDLRDLKKYDPHDWIGLVVTSDSVLNNSQLLSVDPTTFDGFSELKSLTIVNQIRNISVRPNEFPFSKLGRTLEYLKLSNNNVSQIKQGTFSHLQKLRQLSLEDNNITSIEKGAFRVSSIQVVDISNNNLTLIDIGTFTESYIRQIKITHNQLSTIKLPTFPESLEVLNLDYNDLDFLPNGIFQEVRNLKELTLSHNKFVYLPNILLMKNLKKLDLSSNFILYVSKTEFHLIPDLAHLDLSNNKLRKFSLETLPSASNGSHDITVSLAFNHLSNLEFGDNPEGLDRFLLILFGNPWNCKCLEAMELTMKTHKVKRTKCDMKFFWSGKTPVCISRDECLSENLFEGALWEFTEAVEKNKGLVQCDLVSDFSYEERASVKS